MATKRSTIQKSLLAALSLLLFVALSNTAAAFQADGPFLAYQARHAEAWATEDRTINQKLAALEERFGKRPNIIYVLADDVGWGELGWQGGGKHRGTPTPTLDQMALEGMRFWSGYAEPSCTPSRIAINTGRHPVRTGLLSVLWPGQIEGLSEDEVTIAEVLSEAGYSTAMWGKWHLGDLPEHAPENQGYDYAFYGMWNGAPDNWPGSYEMYATGPNPAKAPFYDFPGVEQYFSRTGIDLSEAAFVGRKGQGRQHVEGPAGTLGPERQEAFEEESIGQILEYIGDHADDQDPFFIYWATYAQQTQGSKAHFNDPGVDKVNAQASQMAAHNAHMQRILDLLGEEDIAENTLLIWISDNGPMYAFYPNSGYTWLRGSKGDVLEGGVRVPAIALWPGMIEPNQDPADILHITDLFTTAARIGGAMDEVPSDRVTDGIDQTALLLLGEGHGRRQAMFHYSGGSLGAIRYEDFKVHITEGHGGLPGMDFYNVMRDPGEKFGQLYPGLFAVTPIQMILRDHMMMVQKFPHRVSKVIPQGAELTPHD